jgi:hypothetical protein
MINIVNMKLKYKILSKSNTNNLSIQIISITFA